MLIIRKIPFIAHRKKVVQTSQPVQGPGVSDGDFDLERGELTVEFDRDVSVAGFVPTAVTVNDPESGTMYRATSAHVFAGVIVVIEMEAIGASGGSQAWMNAAAVNGIVAIDDGAEWAGVTELALPYP